MNDSFIQGDDSHMGPIKYEVLKHDFPRVTRLPMGSFKVVKGRKL